MLFIFSFDGVDTESWLKSYCHFKIWAQKICNLKFIQRFWRQLYPMEPPPPANDAASTWWLDPTSKWRHHNRRGTSETTPHLSHLTSNPFPHPISPFHFSFIVFPIVCSTETVSMDIWLRFFVYCPFAAAPPPSSIC